jgi:hypothetical protein
VAIRMQGSWTVSVQSKSAAFPQRFLIEGAASGGGTYSGDVSTPPVFVTGSDWIIRVQHNPGSGWRDSDDQITFPTVSLGQYRFLIQTNDSGGDADFDDLVLACSTPATATDFLLYGHVSSYRGPCIFNPCFPRYVVIDSVATLREALKYPALKDALKKLYPERIKPQPPNPPDPPPFQPMIFSLEDDSLIPPKQTLSIRLKTLEGAPKAKGAAPAPARVATISGIQALSTAVPATRSLIDRLGIASLIDRIRLFCDSTPLPGVVLRFQEYDRTAAELAGGVYTGAGLRENLGVTVTDRNGNYIFRFTRSIGEFFDEAAVDTATGETTVTQSAPDVIVQLIDVMAPGTVLYETAPYFNVPNLRRINVCVPEGRLHPTRCVSGQVIQAVGNVFIGPAPAGPPPFGQPKGFGPRIGFNNSLGLQGRITARNTSGPQPRCAAWAGTLDLFGCFLDHPSVTHYTIRYRPFASGGWTFLSQELRHPLIALAGTPGYNGEIIGPHQVSLHVDGGPAALTSAYLNIESNGLFVSTHRDRRAQVRSWLLSVPMPGPVQLWIEGYDGTGNRVAGAEDSITLFIDNTGPFLDIDDDVTMGGTTLGNCAKFKLPVGQPGAPITVRFKADQVQGFLASYELSMNKGATGAFAVLPPPPLAAPFRLQSYVHGDDLTCSQLRGTFDDPTHDLLSGYVIIDLSPAGGGWLEAGQTFCAFSLNLSATTRVTDGYGGGGTYSAVPVLIGIEA